MWEEAYLESRVLSADPLELIRVLYQHGVESVQAARRHLAAGDIAARSRAIGHAIGAISELDGALDHVNGGTISRRLAELYQYIRLRLTEANMRQMDDPLAEAESLLTTLAEAWESTHLQPSLELAGVHVGPGPQASAWQESVHGGEHTWSA
jgi:flagellar protein FliS